MKHCFHPTEDNIVLHQIHFIYCDNVTKTVEVKAERAIRKALKRFGYTSALLSKLSMLKYGCITKEKYEEMYKVNEQIEEREDLSVGEDLESFIGDIKDGKMNRETIPVNEDINYTFLICLLVGLF